MTDVLAQGSHALQKFNGPHSRTKNEHIPNVKYKLVIQRTKTMKLLLIWYQNNVALIITTADEFLILIIISINRKANLCRIYFKYRLFVFFTYSTGGAETNEKW